MAVSGTIGSATNGDTFYAGGRFNVELSGTFVATVKLQRQLDGTNWRDVTRDGSVVEWTAGMSEVVDEPASNVPYRFVVSSYTSGTVAWLAHPARQ